MSLAIGVGCRRSCPSQAIVDLVTRSCEGLDMHPARLFTLDRKRDEAGLSVAAATLGLPLVFLTADDLRAALPHVSIRSPVVEGAVGVPSVAEAAALAGAGAGARLIVPRQAAGGATCAVALQPAAAVR